jgi:hypothetical protein
VDKFLKYRYQHVIVPTDLRVLAASGETSRFFPAFGEAVFGGKSQLLLK